MIWHANRFECSWQIGFTSDRGWLSLCGVSGTIYLDIWHWRIRWAAPDHRPLFSERYGHTKWHKLGRLGFHYAKPKRDHHRKATS